MSTQPPPVLVPEEMQKNPATRDYLQKQKDALWQLWVNQSGSSGDNIPATSDEFARRYSLLVHR